MVDHFIKTSEYERGGYKINFMQTENKTESHGRNMIPPIIYVRKTQPLISIIKQSREAAKKCDHLQTLNYLFHPKIHTSTIELLIGVDRKKI